MLNNVMKDDSELILNAAIGSLYLDLLNLGFRVEDSCDFEEFKNICQLRDNPSVGAHSDGELFEFTDGNSFFMAVYDQNDCLVATVAAMFEDLKRTNLAQVWQRRIPRLYGGEIKHIRSPAAHDICGKVAYFGDLWVARGHPAGGLGLLLPRLSLLYALNKFSPDYCYALQTPRIAERRAMEIGFSHSQRRAIIWEKPPEGFNEDFWISYARADDLHYLAYAIVEKIHRKIVA